MLGWERLGKRNKKRRVVERKEDLRLDSCRLVVDKRISLRGAGLSCGLFVAIATR